ncbi:MAG TPA: aldehyde-activating protein [Rhodobacteraceae bacterium]|nr:aldehyde-activating protein [Paracoccaceae bacterium]
MSTGRCTCDETRFRLTADPIIIHACHCTWCQRETGSAFALNGVIETDRIEVTRAAPVAVDLPTASGGTQRVMRCARCQVALWSHYLGSSAALAYVRMGTLDDTSRVVPSVHIFTATKQNWLDLPADGAPVFEEFYRPSAVLSPERYARFKAAIGR